VLDRNYRREQTLMITKFLPIMCLLARSEDFK
jgi:hypothetical protein